MASEKNGFLTPYVLAWLRESATFDARTANRVPDFDPNTSPRVCKHALVPPFFTTLTNKAQSQKESFFGEGQSPQACSYEMQAMRLALRFHHARNTIWLTLLISCFFNCVHGRRFNVTVDDQDGDPTNGNKIIYTPSTSWQTGQNCTTCTAQPSPQSSAYLGTWMDSTFNPNGTGTNGTPGQIIQASLTFTGTLIHILL